MSSHSGTISVMPGHDPTSVPFQVGDLACEFRLVHDPSGPNSSRLRLEWTEARSDSVLKVTEGSIAAFSAHSASSPQELLDRRNRPSESFFPPTSRGALYLWAAPYSYTDHTAHYHASHVYYVKIELTTPDDGLFTWERRVAELEARTAALSLASAAAASRCLSLSRTPAPHDVCLDFPGVGKQIWTNDAFLAEISPYYEDLLWSRYVDGAACGSDQSSEPTEDFACALEDSDLEVDALELDDQYCHPGPSLVPPFKRVVITEGSYRTYSAALVWLQTGHIEFAPLSSRSDTDVDNGAYDDESESSNAGALCASADPQPRLVLARASPKSVYRLADLLSLDTLKSLAFANFVSQLTAASAAFELYSEAATTYPELRDVVLAFVVRHWDEAKSSDAMQEMERRAGVGQLPVGAAKTAMLLAKALAEDLGC